MRAELALALDLAERLDVIVSEVETLTRGRIFGPTLRGVEPGAESSPGRPQSRARIYARIPRARRAHPSRLTRGS